MVNIQLILGENMSEIPVFKFALREDLKDDDRFLPTKGEPKATGWDVRIALTNDQKELVIKPHEYVKIPLGFRAFCPEGWWFELRPRSSSFAKKNLQALYGVVDETYEGELIFAAQYALSTATVQNLGKSKENMTLNLRLNHGDAIGQIIPVKRQEMIVEKISNSDYDLMCKARASIRGAGGFGSTL